MNQNAVFTIVSSNYLAYAVTLGKSLRAKDENTKFYIFLCDAAESPELLESICQIEQYGFTVISMCSLYDVMPVDHLHSMLTRYSILEMNTAVKPFVIKYLFLSGLEKIVYLDPDILVYCSLYEIFDMLDNSNIVLTPHIIAPYPDDNKSPSEIDIGIAGLYNLGFIGLKNSTETHRMLDWWGKRLVRFGYMAPSQGMHVDQKWIDYVPVWFDGVSILKDKRFNVAYWNLNERTISFDNEIPYVDNNAVVFFHFSGFDLKMISRHQNRHKFDDFPGLRKFFESYALRLEANGHMRFKTIPYAYGRIPGTHIAIPDASKSLLDKDGLKISHVDSRRNVFRHLLKETIPGISDLFYSIYEKRSDLRNAFPELRKNKQSQTAFSKWIKLSTKLEYGIHDAILSQDFDPHIDDKAFGLNLIGYFDTMTGVGEAARSLYKLVRQTSIPFSLVNMEAQHLGRYKIPKDIEFHLTSGNVYNTNISMVNADQTWPLQHKLGKDKKNIGFWHWELEDSFPFRKEANTFDEIWCWSKFNADIYRKFTDKPVVRIPYSYISHPHRLMPKHIVRSKFRLDNSFVFMFAFDYDSCVERKNPFAVIEAFKLAKEKMPQAKLIIKTNHSFRFPHEAHDLTLTARGVRDIIICNSAMSARDYFSLFNVADCYISLHRSEGLGLPIFEAMDLGKPVIATNYGGNTDVMLEDCSYPVRYEYTEVKKSFGPYQIGSRWADPDVLHAAERMIEVYCNPREVASKTTAAKALLKHMSSESRTIFMRELVRVSAS